MNVIKLITSIFQHDRIGAFIACFAFSKINPSRQFFESFDEEIGKCSNVLEKVAGLRVNGISGE